MHMIPSQNKIDKLYFDSFKNQIYFLDNTAVLKSYDLGNRKMINQKRLSQIDQIGQFAYVNETNQLAYYIP